LHTPDSYNDQKGGNWTPLVCADASGERGASAPTSRSAARGGIPVAPKQSPL